MMDNSKQIIERMQASFPHIYNVYDKSTVLYALLSVFGKKYGMRTDIIDRLYAMIGIDSTYDEDLEYRWGSLLGIYKQIEESYNDYRSRLKIVYSSLSGGTAEAIKYAIASATGLGSDTNTVNEYIHVYDAWKYPYQIDESLLGIEITDEASLYGSIICTVDLSNVTTNVEHAKIMDAINRTKASGINPCLIFTHNTSEQISLPRNDELYDIIRFNTEDNADFFNTVNSTALLGEAILGRAILGIAIEDYNNSEDSVVDNIKYPANESGSINKNTSNIWSSLGTNTAILNQNFVTNAFMESDECIDIIKFI